MTKVESNPQGPQSKRYYIEVCSVCPLLGDEGFVKGDDRKPCEEEAYRKCSQTLGEKTTPKITSSGLTEQPDGQFIRWRRKNLNPRD
jgi:hypothetical protein